MAKSKTMKLFEFTITEHNGEQEYTTHHCVKATTVKGAELQRNRYAKNWYGNADVESGDVGAEKTEDGYNFEDVGVSIDVSDVTETTEEKFKQDCFERAFVDRH